MASRELELMTTETLALTSVSPRVLLAMQTTRPLVLLLIWVVQL